MDGKIALDTWGRKVGQEVLGSIDVLPIR
jgi:hypothetical protein